MKLLTNPCTFFWNDAMDVYRQDERDRDSNGNSTGYRKVQSAQAVACSKKDTPNYDEYNSPGGQGKQNNIFTSDKVNFATGVDLRTEDAVKLTLSDSTVSWYTVSGDPKSRRLIPHQSAYLVTTTPPKVAAGYWNV